VPGGPAQHDEGSAQVGRDDSIEGRQVAIGDRPERHDAGAVHHHVEPAEGAERLLEEAVDRGRVRHVRLDREGLATTGLDLGRCGFGLGGIAGVVQDDGEAVARQAERDLPADASGRAGDEGNSRVYFGHRCPPLASSLVFRRPPGAGGRHRTNLSARTRQTDEGNFYRGDVVEWAGSSLWRNSYQREKEKFSKFSAILPTPETTGDFDETCLAAGASAALVRSIRPARDVVLSMAMEAEQILAR
jgi:hypothetical protein